VDGLLDGPPCAEQPFLVGGRVGVAVDGRAQTLVGEIAQALLDDAQRSGKVGDGLGDARSLPTASLRSGNTSARGGDRRQPGAPNGEGSDTRVGHVR
jgi:hypothetical protein